MCVCVCVRNTHFFIWIYKGFVPTFTTVNLYSCPATGRLCPLCRLAHPFCEVSHMSQWFLCYKMDGNLAVKIFLPFRIIKAKNSDLWWKLKAGFPNEVIISGYQFNFKSNPYALLDRVILSVLRCKDDYLWLQKLYLTYTPDQHSSTSTKGIV
jgi:hypothetical protein